MGIKQIELVPIASPSPITPASKDEGGKFFQVSRTDTVGVVKAQIPAQGSVIGVWMYGSVNSDAATTATVTIQLQNNSGTISTGTVDVKANGATTAIVQMTNLPNIEPNPLVGDIKVVAIYAETGTASTTGGPWKFRIDWV